MTETELAAWAIEMEREHNQRKSGQLPPIVGVVEFLDSKSPEWYDCDGESDYRRGFSHGLAYAVEVVHDLYLKGFVRPVEIACILDRFTLKQVYPWRYAAFKDVMSGKPREGHPHIKQESWPEIRNRIFERDGKVCADCGATQRLQVDHIVPVCAWGPPTDDNLQVLCKTCNGRKGTS